MTTGAGAANSEVPCKKEAVQRDSQVLQHLQHSWEPVAIEVEEGTVL